MSLIVLVSPGGSPGVTTTGLALALAWPRKVVLAECDPAGGAVLAGLWRGQPPACAGSAGLVRYALLAQQDAGLAAAELCAESVPLSARPCRQFVLPAPAGPLAEWQIAAAWPALAAAFAAAPADVIADAGRLDGQTALAPLLAAAGTVLMICRPLSGRQPPPCPGWRRWPASAPKTGPHRWSWSGRDPTARSPPGRSARPWRSRSAAASPTTRAPPPSCPTARHPAAASAAPR